MEILPFLVLRQGKAFGPFCFLPLLRFLSAAAGAFSALPERENKSIISSVAWWRRFAGSSGGWFSGFWLGLSGVTVRSRFSYAGGGGCSLRRTCCTGTSAVSALGAAGFGARLASGAGAAFCCGSAFSRGAGVGCGAAFGGCGAAVFFSFGSGFTAGFSGPSSSSTSLPA